MSSQSFPVTVLVRRPDGTSESVRVGTAERVEDGFRLSLGELSIGAVADPAPSRARSVAPPAGAEGTVFPPYGRSKGAPIVGASIQDLEYYISGSRRSLDDPSKARWHEKERVLLAAMEAELARQTGGAAAGPSGASSSSRSSSSGGQDDYGDAPPYSDDDIPF